MWKKVILWLFFFLLGSNSYAQTIAFNSKAKGYYYGGQFTFDLYKPFISTYAHFKKNVLPVLINPDEGKVTYFILLRRFFEPKFFLFQTTFYQLASLSTVLETDYSDTFNRFNINGDLNIIRSIGGDYEDPYAFTIFLGNVLYLIFAPNVNDKPVKKKQSGSALAGFAYSFGYHQISDNIYLHDHWHQFEILLVGKLKEPGIRKMSWNFRFGVKYHNNPLFRNIFIVSLERNHSHYKFNHFSFTKNSVFKYKVYIPMSFSDNPPFTVYQYISYGKKFPISLFRKKMFLVFGGGVKWEWVYKFDRKIKKFQEKPSGNLVWLIQPNIEF